jgi:hypothetical protein
VYAIGSFGRVEASQHSDLDLFIIGKTKKNEKDEEQRLLTKLEEIRLKAELIGVTSKLNIPEFSGDGKYLSHYTISELLETLGKPEDDVTNTFTARLLLLLESRPLIGTEIYNDAIRKVVESYLQAAPQHEGLSIPTLSPPPKSSLTFPPTSSDEGRAHEAS